MQKSTFINWLLVASALLAAPLQAQDFNFTQFYASPLHLNPAMAGTTPHYRLSAIYRNQWPSVPGAFQAFQASFDYNIDEANSGFGLLLSNSWVPANGLTNPIFSGHYSFFIPINREWVARLGVSAGLNGWSQDRTDLTFEDQLVTGGPTAEPLRVRGRVRFDVGTGALIYNRYFWAGLGVHHLNRPSQSFFDDGDERLAMRWSGHLGGRIPLRSTRTEDLMYLAPAAVYQRQGLFDHLDLGINYYFKPMLVGLWYRGIPIQRNVRGRVNQDMIAGLVGVRVGNFMFTYSYDVTISGFGGSGGAHEISVILSPPYDKRNKRGTRHIDCPVFF
ncbi:MAG: PorP/SprF family type IX secretion system membrane protein [Bernardetiaceae bacterium]|jgi:type IX secretion system PorP/SprF family membrane protein|nr:PorP/SprF family type IX secretion system membrane protein [Bernardetiaceae bacterium]